MHLLPSVWCPYPLTHLLPWVWCPKCLTHLLPWMWCPQPLTHLLRWVWRLQPLMHLLHWVPPPPPRTCCPGCGAPSLSRTCCPGCGAPNPSRTSKIYTFRIQETQYQKSTIYSLWSTSAIVFIKVIKSFLFERLDSCAANGMLDWHRDEKFIGLLLWRWGRQRGGVNENLSSNMQCSALQLPRTYPDTLHHWSQWYICQFGYHAWWYCPTAGKLGSFGAKGPTENKLFWLD